MKEKLLCLTILVLILLTAGIAPTAASAAEPNPTVSGPITGGCSPSCPSPPGPTDGIHIPEAFDGVSNQAPFIAADYTEEEYFFSGTATAFEPVCGELLILGKSVISPTQVNPAAKRAKKSALAHAD